MRRFISSAEEGPRKRKTFERSMGPGVVLEVVLGAGFGAVLEVEVVGAQVCLPVFSKRLCSSSLYKTTYFLTYVSKVMVFEVWPTRAFLRSLLSPA